VRHRGEHLDRLVVAGRQLDVVRLRDGPKVELTAAGRWRRHRAWACTHPVLWSWFAGQLAFTLLVTFVTVLAVTSLYETRVWWQQHQERRTVRPGTDVEGRR